MDFTEQDFLRRRRGRCFLHIVVMCDGSIRNSRLLLPVPFRQILTTEWFLGNVTAQKRKKKL